MLWKKNKDQRVRQSVLKYEFSEEKYKRRLALRGQLKVFISHRWDYDAHLHERLSSFRAREAGIHIADLSISSDLKVQGPRGGQVPNAVIYDKIVDKMDQCHLVVAPSKVPRKSSEWVRRELETAVVLLKKPILFVDHKEDQRMHTSMMMELSQIKDAKIYHATSDDASLIRELNKIISELVDADMNTVD